MSAENFFAFARARHDITLARRAGLPRPWTDDAVLQQYRFTNVFRELDRTTLWIAEHVRRPLDEMVERGEIELWQQVLGMVLAREFNRTTTLETIFCQERLMGEPIAWAYIRGDVDLGALEHYMRRNCSKPWVTGAYIIKTPDGMDKLAGALWMVGEARRWLTDMHPNCWQSMETLHDTLRQLPYLGGFTAYEIVTDLRWMAVGRDWPDVMTWACAGPGAIRGLHRVHGRDYRRSLSQRQALAEMRDLLAMSRDGQHWPNAIVTPGMHNLLGEVADWPAWELREVEHTLCEFDKIMRVRNGEGFPRGRYK